MLVRRDTRPPPRLRRHKSVRTRMVGDVFICFTLFANDCCTSNVLERVSPLSIRCWGRLEALNDVEFNDILRRRQMLPFILAFSIFQVPSLHKRKPRVSYREEFLWVS